MTKNSTKKIPRLRFKGFSGEWEEKKLGELSLVTKLAGFEFTKYVKYENDGKIIALRGLNIKNNSLDLNDVKYIDNSDFSKLGRSKLYINDILFTYVGTVGNSAIVNRNNKFYLAPNVALIRVKDSNLNPLFLQTEISTNNFYKKVIFPLASTSSQMALSMESIRKFKITYPKLLEQQKIGSFFAKLDQLIDLQTQKVEQLKKLKRGYLQKMFPQKGETIPRLRFSEFEGEWEEHRLGDIYSVSTGYPFKSDQFIQDGKFRIITNTNINKHKYVLNKVGHRININDKNIISKYLLKNDDVLMTMDGNVGRSAIVNNNNMLLAQRVGRIKAKDLIKNRYLFEFINTTQIKNYLKRFAIGGIIKHISLNDIKNIFIYIPNNKEQNHIVKFLFNLDENIDFQSEKLNKLSTLKKSYLQRLFF